MPKEQMTEAAARPLDSVVWVAPEQEDERESSVLSHSSTGSVVLGGTPDPDSVGHPGRDVVPDQGRLPRVSVVLPIRNEADHIEACLERLLTQDYPKSLMEIVVVDGCSDDGTQEAVRRVKARNPCVPVRMLVNPKRTVPPAFNAGVCAALGSVIVRMDGHTVPDEDYVSRCVTALMSSGAANVGGVIEPVGTTPFGRAVALVMQHPLGAGDARFRVGGEAGDVDTVPFGAFRRDLFERVGLFDESMVRNEDYEFNVRVRASGERVYLDPSIRSSYTPRSTPRALWGQYFQYGWWRVETWRRHPSSLRWRQALPPAFVASLLALLVMGLLSTVASVSLVAGLATYFAVVVLMSWRLAGSSASVWAVAAAFMILHVAYGAGFLVSLISGGRYPYRARPPHVPRFESGVRAVEPAQGSATAAER